MTLNPESKINFLRDPNLNAEPSKRDFELSDPSRKIDFLGLTDPVVEPISVETSSWGFVLSGDGERVLLIETSSDPNKSPVVKAVASAKDPLGQALLDIKTRRIK